MLLGIEQVVGLIQRGLTTARAIVASVEQGRATVTNADGQPIAAEQVLDAINAASHPVPLVGDAAAGRIDGRHAGDGSRSGHEHLRHRSVGREGLGDVPEDNGAPSCASRPIRCHRAADRCRDVRVAPDGWPAFSGARTGPGMTSTASRVITPLGPVYSPEAMAYSPGTPVWVESQTGYRYGGMRIALPAHRPARPGGILEVNGPDAIVWMDDILGLPAAAERTFGGITFVTFRRPGAWVFGNSQVGCAAVNTATGRAYLLPEMNGTSNTLRGALDGSGHLTVMASRPSRLLVEAAFTPYVRSAAYAPVVSIGPALDGLVLRHWCGAGQLRVLEAWAVQGHREVRGAGMAVRGWRS